MLEIERKFLVNEESHFSISCTGIYRKTHDIAQGYILSTPELVIRLRIENDFRAKGAGLRAIIAIKKSLDKSTFVRSEEEYEIPIETGLAMLYTLPAVLRKQRYQFGEHTIDCFEGDLEGLIMAEREYETIEEALKDEVPSWAYAEVTDDPTYLNSNLIGKKFVNGAVA